MTTTTSKQTLLRQLLQPWRALFPTALLALVELALPAVGQAQDYTYTTDGATITITHYTGPGGAVDIPDTIDGLPVTSIAGYAFQAKMSLTSVTIPDSVLDIGYSAFSGCNFLTSVTLGNSVTTIENLAFHDCKLLTSVTIPASVLSIGSAFVYCSNLTAITVDVFNAVYSSGDGVLFDKAKTTLIKCPEGKSGHLTIPASVITIGGAAVTRCPNLNRVTIPNSVISIGDAAFESCISLTNVTFGSSITSIGDYAFDFCPRLTEITLPNSLTTIGGLAFAGCGLTSVTIPNGVTTIGGYAFLTCHSLTNITISSSVTTIGDGTFYGCFRLTAITVAALNPVYSSLQGVLFDQSQTTLIQCPGGKAGSYTIPNSVSSIANWAFQLCTNLTSVTIPTTVTSMGYNAFERCTSLTSVTIPESITYISAEAFRSCTSLTNITIPNTVSSIGNYAFGGCGLVRVTLPSSLASIGDGAFVVCASLTGVYCEGNAPALGSDVFTSSDKAIIYYLPGTTGWGATFGGRPTALWMLPYPLILSNGPGFGVQTNRFGFTISWATNVPVVVEACTNLVNPAWSPVRTNTLTAGSSYFSDPQWTNHARRFYRLRSP